MMKRNLSSGVCAFLLGWILLVPSPAAGDYRPLWVLIEQFDYVLDSENLGLRVFPYGDSSTVATYAVVVREVFQQPDEPEMPAVAAGDTILVLARGNWLKDDREDYLLFVLKEQRRGYPGLPLPLFEGKTLPCDRFQPMFTRDRVDCPSARVMGADFCACVREAIYRYQDLLAAREEDREIEFLRASLTDENTIIVLAAMGTLRQRKPEGAMEWMEFLRDDPEFQVRSDLAESIPYLPSEVSGQVGIWLLDDPEQRIQILASFGLGRLRYEPAAPVLAAILEDPARDRLVRASCLNALDRIGSPLLIPALEKAVAVEPDSALAEGFRIHLEKQKRKLAEGK